MATLETRKPVTELTASDLREYPVWEYAIDEEDRPEQDETWVRPVPGTTVPKDRYSQIVHADFRTAGDMSLDGFVVVNTIPGAVELTPGAIVGAFGYFCIPSASRSEALSEGYDWSITERDELVAGFIHIQCKPPSPHDPSGSDMIVSAGCWSR